MKRRAIIIGNPGEEGAENYCKGVYKDVEAYKRFLRQPYGGYWANSAIIGPLVKPSAAEVRRVIASLKPLDYALVIFSGHAEHSDEADSTVLEVKEGETMNEQEFYRISPKTTLILDCCRTEALTNLEEAVKAEFAMPAALAELHPLKCRQYYKNRIEQCGESMVVLYACSIGEKSYDNTSGKGGVYSHSLLSVAEAWVEQTRREIDTSKNFGIFSVIQAHTRTHKKIVLSLENRQTPDVLKPRSGPYFPFAVVA